MKKIVRIVYLSEIAICAFIAMAFAIDFVPNAFATDYGGDGGQGYGGGGSGSCSASTEYARRSCIDCTNSSNATNTRCPVWRRTDSSGFTTAWNNRMGDYNQNAANTCMSWDINKDWDGHNFVTWAGKVDDGVNRLLNAWPVPSFFGQNYKISGYMINNDIQGAATNRNFRSYVRTGGWDDGGKYHRGIMNILGVSEGALAFYCPGFEGQADCDYNGCPGWFIRKPDLSGWSGIQMGNGWQNAISAKPGQTVNFGHAVSRDDAEKTLDPDGGRYRLFELHDRGSSGVSSMTNQATEQSFWNSSWNGSWNGRDVNLAGGYGSVNFTIPANATNGERWCQRIAYYSAGSNNQTGPWGYSNYVCVVADVRPAPDNPSGGDDGDSTNGHVDPQGDDDNIIYYGKDSNNETVPVSLEVKNNASNATNKNWVSEGVAYDKITAITRATYAQTSFNYCHGYDEYGFCNNWDNHYNAPVITQPVPTIQNVADWPNSYVWAKPTDVVTFRTNIGKNWMNMKSDHGVFAGYGSCNITGTAGALGCATAQSDNVKLQNRPITKNDVAQTIRQSVATDRSYAFKSALHCHTSDSHTGRCNGYDFSGVTAAGTGSSSAAVKIPYNYTTNPHTETPNIPVLFPGEDLTVSTQIDTKRKRNTPVSPDDYATRTKPTVYEVVTFVANPTSNKPGGYGDSESTTGSSTYTSTPGSGTSCGYYTSGMSLQRGCNVIARETDRVYNDSDTPLSGRTNESIWGDTIDIDDAPVGTKFCVAVSVWPATSHNSATANSNGNAGDPSMTDSGAGSAWQHSAPKCFDIAKKPNLQVWGSSIYSSGGITTSQTNKRQSDDSYRLFGSWGEYGAISRSPIDGLGSGAAFGYELNNGGTFAKRGGIPNSGTVSDCMYSKATVTNKDCGDRLGSANISDASISITTARLIARYASPTGKSLSSNSLSGLDGKYYVNGNVTINASSIPKGRTIVIYATGNITINGNITYNDGPYNNIEDLPQVLLIAQNIYIAESVTRVDAWLVAGRQGGTGIIDTCVGHSIGSLGAGECNQKLTINGPLFANKLVTKRTGGAGAGNASIDPAEVFNLRADSYMWAMAQAQHYKQAVSTNLKNLPPRY